MGRLYAGEVNGLIAKERTYTCKSWNQSTKTVELKTHSFDKN